MFIYIYGFIYFIFAYGKRPYTIHRYTILNILQGFAIIVKELQDFKETRCPRYFVNGYLIASATETSDSK